MPVRNLGWTLQRFEEAIRHQNGEVVLPLSSGETLPTLAVPNCFRRCRCRNRVAGFWHFLRFIYL